MDTHPYLTDLSDAEWRVVQPLLPSEATTGRPRQHPLRTIVDAIVYVLRAGCAWRLLPREFPPWKTVFHYLRQVAAGWDVATSPSGAAPAAARAPWS